MTAPKEHHPLVELAKKSVESYVREGRKIDAPAELTPEMQEKAGVFVCVKAGGELRGCIGTFLPAKETVAEEVINNAISAACEDPRFCRVEPGELGSLEYSVDVLSTPEPVKSVRELDPKKYGVIVQAGFRKGLLLPDLEGVDTVDEQIAIAKRKAGIDMTEPVSIYRFEVNRYE